MHANGPFEDGIDLGGHIETIPAYWDGFWKHWLTHNGVKQWFEPETGAYKIPPDNLDLPNACHTGDKKIPNGEEFWQAKPTIQEFYTRMEYPYGKNLLNGHPHSVRISPFGNEHDHPTCKPANPRYHTAIFPIKVKLVSDGDFTDCDSCVTCIDIQLHKKTQELCRI